VPTVTDSDVAAGLLTKWAATAALNDLVPATAVFRGRAAEKFSGTISKPPYAKLTVTEQGRQLFSGPKYLATFSVTVEAYTAAEPPVANTLRAALDVAFNGTTSAPAAGLTAANGTVISSFAEPGAATRPTGERIDGRDVVKTTAAYKVLVESDRG